MRYFFASSKIVDSCGLFGIGHILLFVITILCVSIVTYLSRNKNINDVKKTIRMCTLLLWILEIIKIIFNISIGNIKNFNTYIPLYFCSLTLYAGILSSYGKGILKRIGDVFLSTGGIIAGIIFLIFPDTSLAIYPVFHYISLQSFVFHGIMIYIGVLMIISGYIEIRKRDLCVYFLFVFVMGIVAYIFNCFFHCNLMFISDKFYGNILGIIYEITGKFYSIIIIIGQAIVPFFVGKILYNIIAIFRIQKSTDCLKKI